MHKIHGKRRRDLLGLLGAGVLAFGLGACDETSPSEITGTESAFATENTEEEAHVPGGGVERRGAPQSQERIEKTIEILTMVASPVTLTATTPV